MIDSLWAWPRYSVWTWVSEQSYFLLIIKKTFFFSFNFLHARSLITLFFRPKKLLAIVKSVSFKYVIERGTHTRHIVHTMAKWELTLRSSQTQHSCMLNLSQEVERERVIKQHRVDRIMFPTLWLISVFDEIIDIFSMLHFFSPHFKEYLFNFSMFGASSYLTLVNFPASCARRVQSELDASNSYTIIAGMPRERRMNESDASPVKVWQAREQSIEQIGTSRVHFDRSYGWSECSAEGVGQKFIGANIYINFFRCSFVPWARLENSQ